MQKITGIYDNKSPFFTFYNSITSQQQETVMYAMVKDRFLAVDTSSTTSSNHNNGNVLEKENLFIKPSNKIFVRNKHTIAVELIKQKNW